MPWRLLVVALLCVLLALASLLAGWRLVAALLLALGSGIFLWARRLMTPVSPARGLVLCGQDLLFDDASGAPARPVLSLDDRFGVTMLANRARSRATLALTSPRSTFFVGAWISPQELPRCRDALAAAHTVASDERALEPAAPDGLPLCLSGEALVRLYEGLQRIDPACTERLFLTDVRGEAVTLDQRSLVVGERVLDLDAALDWKGLLFQEGAPREVTIYQATQVRQGPHELSFVSLMPALSSPLDPGDLPPQDALLERATQRDLMLLRDVSAEPPPRALRVAVDRVFMLPLRAALHTAPRQRAAGAPRSVV